MLARQLDIPLHDIDFDHVPLYLRDGSQLDKKTDKEVGGRKREGRGGSRAGGGVWTVVGVVCWT